MSYKIVKQGNTISNTSKKSNTIPNPIFDAMLNPNCDFAMQMNTVHNERIKTIKKIFGGRIKQNFLIAILERVKDCLGPQIFEIFNFLPTAEQMVTRNMEDSDYEICRQIVGIHRFNITFLSDDDRVGLEKSEGYRIKLVNDVITQLKLHNTASVFFRHNQILIGEEFLYFPVPYKLFAISIQGLEKSNKKRTKLGWFYASIFEKSLATLSMLENNFLTDGYPICRGIIELYLKLLTLRINPSIIEEHNKFIDWELNKNCCGNDLPEEFRIKMDNHKSKWKPTAIEYLHYGWVDSIPNYHEIVSKQPYSTNGLIEYIESLCDDDQRQTFITLSNYYKMCHSYTHGNVGYSKYPLLHYFELSSMLGLMIPHTYKLMCEEFDETIEILGMDVLTGLEKDIEKLANQYAQRTTENFDNYYKK